MHEMTPATPAQAVAPPADQQRPPSVTLPPDDPAPLVERRADDAPDSERAALLRQAGDRYLTEAADPEAALRCYSRALDADTEDNAKFSPDDNWLLMAIKNAREKEAHRAN